MTRKSSNDNKFIELLKNKDNDAWTEFFNDYRPMLQGKIKYMLTKRQVDRSLVEQVESDVWLIIFTKIETFENRGEGSFKAWIHGIVNNLTRKEAIRKRNTPVNIPDGIDQESFFDYLYQQQKLFSESTEEIALRNLVSRELLPIFHSTLKILSPRDRLIIIRYFIHKQKPKQIAKEMGLEVNNVYRILDRAKKTFMTYLQAKALFGGKK